MRSSITSSRNIIALVLVIAMAALGAAAAQTYGTAVDEAWYDTVAETYQNPPVYQHDNGTWFSEWPYADAYPAIAFDIEVTGLNQVEYVAPSDSSLLGPDCSLSGTAAVAERLMRDRVRGLRNLIGPDSAQFRAEILAMGREQLVRFQTTGLLSTSDGLPAVALANGIRIEPEYFTESSGQYINTYTAYFSLTRLQELGAIEDGMLAIAKGTRFSDVCRFNLNDLP